MPTLQIVLAIAGCIALLVGLFGGGVKAKEIEVPKISPLSRIFSILIGIVMIGAATWLSFPNFLPSPDPTPKSIKDQTTEPVTSTPVPKFGWVVYFEIAFKEGYWKQGTNSYEISADCPDVEYLGDIDKRIEFSVDQNAQLFPDKVVEFHFLGFHLQTKGNQTYHPLIPTKKQKLFWDTQT